MILIKIIKFNTKITKYLKFPIKFPKNNNPINSFFNTKPFKIQKINHNQIAEIDDEQNVFSSIVRTSSPYSFLVLNDINQSYALSINNQKDILKEIKKEKTITKEVYDQHQQDFILNILWNGYLPVHDNINITSEILTSNQNNLQKKLLYIFDDNLANINLKAKLTQLLILYPDFKDRYDSIYNLYKTLDLIDIEYILKKHNIAMSEETLSFYHKIKLNYNYGNVDIEHISDLKQNVFNNLHVKHNLSKIITDW